MAHSPLPYFKHNPHGKVPPKPKTLAGELYAKQQNDEAAERRKRQAWRKRLLRGKTA